MAQIALSNGEFHEWKGGVQNIERLISKQCPEKSAVAGTASLLTMYSDEGIAVQEK